MFLCVGGGGRDWGLAEWEVDVSQGRIELTCLSIKVFNSLLPVVIAPPVKHATLTLWRLFEVLPKLFLEERTVHCRRDLQITDLEKLH